jgi:hypothetical protein
LSTLTICFVLRRIFSLVGGLVSSAQWNISSGEHCYSIFLNTREKCFKLAGYFGKLFIPVNIFNIW